MEMNWRRPTARTSKSIQSGVRQALSLSFRLMSTLYSEQTFQFVLELCMEPSHPYPNTETRANRSVGCPYVVLRASSASYKYDNLTMHRRIISYPVTRAQFLSPRQSVKTSYALYINYLVSWQPYIKHSAVNISFKTQHMVTRLRGLSSSPGYFESHINTGMQNDTANGLSKNSWHIKEANFPSQNQHHSRRCLRHSFNFLLCGVFSLVYRTLITYILRCI